jgi:hypothetical protein
VNSSGTYIHYFQYMYDPNCQANNSYQSIKHFDCLLSGSGTFPLRIIDIVNGFRNCRYSTNI